MNLLLLLDGLFLKPLHEALKVLHIFFGQDIIGWG
jgi:hypothetical protein